MDNKRSCPKFERYTDAFDNNAVLPRELTEHAKECEYCSFWTSYAAATKEAAASTERTLYNDCPPTIHFQIMILESARLLQKGIIKKLSAKFAASIPENIEELSYLIQHHLNPDCSCGCFCDLCHDYAQKLIASVEHNQKLFAEKIRSGETISLRNVNPDMIRVIHRERSARPN